MIVSKKSITYLFGKLLTKIGARKIYRWIQIGVGTISDFSVHGHFIFVVIFHRLVVLNGG